MCWLNVTHFTYQRKHMRLIINATQYCTCFTNYFYLEIHIYWKYNFQTFHLKNSLKRHLCGKYFCHGLHEKSSLSKSVSFLRRTLILFRSAFRSKAFITSILYDGISHKLNFLLLWLNVGGGGRKYIF